MSVLLQVMKEMLLIYFYLFSQPKAAKCVFIVYSVCQISCSWIFAISLFSKPPCLLLCLNGKKQSLWWLTLSLFYTSGSWEALIAEGSDCKSSLLLQDKFAELFFLPYRKVHLERIIVPIITIIMYFTSHSIITTLTVVFI